MSSVLLNPYFVNLDDHSLISWSVNDTASGQMLANGFPFVHLYKFVEAAAGVVLSSAMCGYVNSSFYRLDIALAGYNATALDNTTALSYRGLASSEYYDVGTEPAWYSASNWLWRVRRAFVIRGDKPSTSTEFEGKLGHFEQGRLWLILSSVFTMLPFFVLSSFPYGECVRWNERRYEPALCRLLAATLLIAFNPLPLLVFGSLCYIKDGKEDSMEWVMCSRNDSYALFAGFGVVLIVYVLSVVNWLGLRNK